MTAPAESAAGRSDRRLERMEHDVERCLGRVRSAMQRSLVAKDERHAPLYHWLTYHLGWTTIDGEPASATIGKLLRPRACLLACAAVGADMNRAIEAAAAIELTHAFSLIHDDIEDGDRLRRGRPALWTQIGVAQAINAGDALLIAARQALGASALPQPMLVLAFRAFDAACRDLAEGQYLDLAFEGAAAVSPDDYLAMVEAKTGALLGAATMLGALCGGADEPVALAMGRFGRKVGLAFQMADDVLGLWGDPALTGKPSGADLARRKRSLPVVLALADPALSEDLRRWLSRPGERQTHGADDAAVALAGRAAGTGVAKGRRVAPTKAPEARPFAGDAAEAVDVRAAEAAGAAALAARVEARGHRAVALELARRAANEAVAALADLSLDDAPAEALRALAEQAVIRVA